MLRSILLTLALGMALVACAGMETKQQQIAVACESAATGLDALTVAKTAGRITQAQLQDAIAIYKPTVAYCQPVATSLSTADYLALLKAAAELTAKAGERR